MKKFLKGMFKDSERVDQLDGTYRDALNANINYLKGAIVNEQGNAIVSIDANKIDNIIGECTDEAGRLYVFGLSKYNNETYSIIAVMFPKEKIYTVLFASKELNFQPNYTIEATVKVNSKGDTILYFTDNYIVKSIDVTGIEYVSAYNPPRTFNVTRQLTSTYTPEDIFKLYGSDEYTVQKLDLFMNTGDIPQFKEVLIKEGGGVVSGTYHLALAYSDEDGNATNYMVTSNAVHIVTAREDSIPTETITGDPQGSQSNKSIYWEVTIPAKCNYSSIRPVVIQRFGGQNQESSEFAYQLPDIELPKYNGSERDILVSYSGLETVSQSSVSEVVIDNVVYQTCKTLHQLDNVLYAANLQSRGDLGFQRFANNIKVDAVTKSISKFDPRIFTWSSLNFGYSFFKKEGLGDELNFTTSLYPNQLNEGSDVNTDDFSGRVRKGYKDPKLFYKNKSFRRSEVYAFYISFVLKDGTESYAYHIPGRAAKELNRLKPGVYENSNLSALEGNYYYEEVKDNYSAKLYQLYDTDLYAESTTMGFWENQNETYPFTNDFDVHGVESDGSSSVIPITSIRGQKVRHHKMPSNKNKAFSYIYKNPNNILNGAEDKFDPRIDEAIGDNSDFQMNERINLLGIKLSSLKIPKFILNQVQGYKIYYAKRTQENKTIIGQSIPVPAWLLNNTVPTMDSEKAKTGPFYKAWMMYGGIPESTLAYPVKRTVSNQLEWNVSPVFGFHDFNLLKNKHTLTGVTHINIQNVMVMRHYKGGPRASAPLADNLDSFYNVDWVNTDIGNTFDPEYEGTDPIPENLRIKAFRTSAMLAAAYYSPEDVPSNIYSKANLLTSGTQLNSFPTFFDNFKSVLSVKPNSTTYIGNNINVKTTDGGEFHGVDYIYNAAGESKAVIGLSTGLPMLVGYLSNLNGGWLQDINNYGDGRFSWYHPDGYLSLVLGAQTVPYAHNDYESLRPAQPSLDAFNVGEGNKISIGGLPATYLVNLCSLKSDVFNSFDEQLLVWTGYYKPLNNIDLQTGTDGDGVNYYTGAQSDDIFGGDTYISRYGFRSTSHTYGNVFRGNQISPNLLGSPLGNPVPDTKGNNTPTSTLFYFMCESDDLLGYRHIADSLVGVNASKSSFFDAATAHAVIFNSPINDNTHMDNLLYMNNYSLNQDIRVAVPYPKYLNNVTRFPNRVIRSANDEGSVSDKYRIYQALDYKDIPKHRGDIWKLFSIGSVLYIHTERTVYVTKGDQEIQLSDNSQAYVGSGNIFAIDPDEMITTKEGYGGTDSQFSSITTRYGHFYLNRKDKKAYMISESIEEVSSLGMEKWFIDNVPYQLEEQFNIDLDAYHKYYVNSDSPTSDFGFTTGYDPVYKRLLITKRERVPKPIFTTGWNNGSIKRGKNRYSYVFYDGNTPILLSDDKYFQTKTWTISYYPEIKVWGSRHSYAPVLFSNTAENLYSLVNNNPTTNIWEHSAFNAPGRFFNQTYNFEFEYIDNTAPGSPKVFSSIYYWGDVTKVQALTSEVTKYISPGFDEFYVYNTTQISGLKNINYLSNSRLVDRVWYINDFRDMSRTTELTYLDTNTVGPQFEQLMFTSEGNINPNYININKSWFEQKRFVDHYLGVRLISNNNDQNLISLYAAGTKHRQAFR